MKPALLLLVLSLGCAFHAGAQIVSTFDTDAEGWTFTAATTSIPVDYHATGGNPDGYASVTYSANNGTTVQNWIAPAKFHGSHLARSLGMNLSFSLQQSAAVPAGVGYGHVSVRKGELTSRYRLPFQTLFSSGVSFDGTHSGEPVSFARANANYDIEVDDLNRDGKPDLLVERTAGSRSGTHTPVDPSPPRRLKQVRNSAPHSSIRVCLMLMAMDCRTRWQ